MNNATNDDIQLLLQAASTGLTGIALKALAGEGKEAALTSLEAIEAGRAFVEVKVLLSKRGISAEGHFCSHGGKTRLFEVALHNPPVALQ